MSDFGDYEVTEAMIVYGGGFVSGLGRLYRQADRDNKQRLATAFPEYFAQYREIAILKLDRLRWEAQP
jgi:hypothetical protein